MPDIIHEVTIAVAPERVYEAITTEAGQKSFWTDQAKVEPKVGSVAVFGFGPSHDTTFNMRVDMLDAPRLVEWHCLGEPDEWNGTNVRWLLEPVDGGTKLRFEHRDWRSDEGAYATCSYTWALILEKLDRYLITGKAAPHFVRSAGY